MSRFKLINIADTIFISIVTLLIVFAWIQFFVKNILLSLFISTFIAIGIILISRWLKTKKYNTQQAQYDKQNNLTLFRLAVQSTPTSKLSNIIKKLIPTKYMPHILKGDIVLTKDNTKHIFTFDFSSQLDESKLLEIIKSKNSDNITIFCSNFNQDTLLTSKAFKNKCIELINLEQLFNIFNSKNISIDTSYIDLNRHKITLREIFKNSISRNKSKGYFISGLVLLFTSLIIPYKIYYVVFSSILLLLSLICRLNKKSTSSNISIFD